jgi:hypothetical protein
MNRFKAPNMVNDSPIAPENPFDPYAYDERPGAFCERGHIEDVQPNSCLLSVSFKNLFAFSRLGLTVAISFFSRMEHRGFT